MGNNIVGGIYKSSVAESVPFDPLRNPGFGGVPSTVTSDEVQSAIEEVSYQVATDVSDKSHYSRSGSVPPNTWLLKDTVPSNISSGATHMTPGTIRSIQVSNQNATAGITLDIYSHDGDGIGLTLLGSVTTAAARTNVFPVNYPVAANKQIGIRTAATSAAAKEIVVGLTMKGNL